MIKFAPSFSTEEDTKSDCIDRLSTLYSEAGIRLFTVAHSLYSQHLSRPSLSGVDDGSIEDELPAVRRNRVRKMRARYSRGARFQIPPYDFDD